jgi:hypothetical protein
MRSSSSVARGNEMRFAKSRYATSYAVNQYWLASE